MAWLSRLGRLRTRPAGHPLAIFTLHGLSERPLPVPDWCFVDVATFRRQLDMLRACHALLPLREAIERLQAGTLPPRAAALTFDDGFAGVHRLAFPILREARIPATCFVVTGLLGGDGSLWFCRLHRAISETHCPEIEWRGRRHLLTDAALRSKASAALQREVKRLPARELEEQVREIGRALGQDTAAPFADASPFRMLDQAAVADMVGSGLVEFGAHGEHHAILGRLTPAEQRGEIEPSVRTVRALTGQAADVFAYPNGQAGDYDPATLDILRECGIAAAVTSVEGRAERSSPLLELPRLPVGPAAVTRLLA